MPTFNDQIQNEADNPELINENIKQLRKWLSTQTHLPDISDEMLMQFHHSCWYSVERTKSCIRVYYSTRSSVPEAFKDRDLERPELVQALEHLYLAVLPVPDSRGYYLMYSGLNNTDPTNFDYLQANRVFHMFMDTAIHRYGQMEGVIQLHDMKGGKLGHLFKCSLSLLRKISIYMQNGVPVRLREVHIVNVLPWIDKLITLLKPFLNKELVQNTYFHKSGSQSLYEHFNANILPEELGGSLPSIVKLHAENVEYMKGMKDYFIEEEKNRMRVISKTKKENVPETSLKNLQID